LVCESVSYCALSVLEFDFAMSIDKETLIG
jgi:hypothetical protein